MPYLKLKIVSGSESGQNDNYSFSHFGGSIGRSEDCDWTLLDSDRFVSKKHLIVSHRDQHFVLTDVSSNGVVINSANAPLGRNNDHILRENDTLVIGKHIVQVEEISLAVEQANPFQQQDDDGDLLGLVMGAEVVKESVQAPKEKFNVADSSDFFKDLKSESELGLGDILSEPLKPSTINEIASPNEHSNPFELGASNPTTTPLDSDIFNTSKPVDDLRIPDDWETFDKKVHANVSISPFEEVDINRQDSVLESSETSHVTTSSLPESDQKFTKEPLLEAMTPATEVENVRAEVPIATQNINLQTATSTDTNSEVKTANNSVNDDFFTLLYEKLGLSKEFKATINKEDVAEDIATILLSTTQGLMSLLASRTAFKQESRLSSTLIQPRSNNPIKFSIDPVDTLEMLLVKKKRGYMTVGDSYDEAMEDIQLHQMAFMSGLQGTLDGVLSQLSPESIESQVNKKSQRFMGLNSNSQCWQLYKEKQPLLAKSVKENLNEVLGSYFSDAYQSQINSFKNDK